MEVSLAHLQFWPSDAAFLVLVVMIAGKNWPHVMLKEHKAAPVVPVTVGAKRVRTPVTSAKPLALVPGQAQD